MSIIEILILAIGLAMDCFSVSLCAGAVAPVQSSRYTMRLSLTFGVFHVFAILIGWLIGGSIATYIEKFDHWVVFVLLGYVGVTMIRDGLQDEAVCFDNDPSKGKLLASLAFATSVDGLSIGIGMAVLNVNIVSSSLFIGLVAFLFSLTGILIGKKLGNTFGNKMLLIGGVILLLIGTNVLYQHLSVDSEVIVLIDRISHK